MDRLSTFAKRLKMYREYKNITLSDLERITGIPAQTLNRYELAQRTPKIDIANIIAEKLGVSPLWLQGYDVSITGWDEEPASEECLNYPVIGEVAAGYGSFAEENATGDFEQIPLEWIKGHSKDDFFVLRVKGNSMYPEFKNGDHVLIKRCSSVDSGNVAVVIYDSEEATLKKVKYVQGEDWLDLVPINPEYETKHIENSDLEECRVLGEAVKIIRHLK